jgi:hypothetical protein
MRFNQRQNPSPLADVMLNAFSTDDALYICMFRSKPGLETRATMVDAHTVRIVTSHQLPKRDVLTALAHDVVQIPRDKHELLAKWFSNWETAYGQPTATYTIKTNRRLQAWDNHRITRVEDMIVLHLPLYKATELLAGEEEKWREKRIIVASVTV